jgi:hypothetical protein
MVNMKMTAEEAKEYTGAPISAGDAPAYPYGLCICLNDDSLKKLGFDDPPPVGTQMRVTAMVTVTSTGVNQQQDGDKEARCELQITDMELTGGAPDATKLYGNSGMNP